MMYIFEVTFQFDDYQADCTYVTTFDGVWMLANVLNQSENVVHFRVNENRTYVSSIKFNAEDLKKWR